MKWKKILKMPMRSPPGVAQQEINARAKQQIIEYEEKYIGPNLDKIAEEQKPGARPLKLLVRVFEEDSEAYDIFGFRDKANALVRPDNTRELGGNAEFIRDVFEEIYRNEGFTVRTDDDTNQGFYDLYIDLDPNSSNPPPMPPPPPSMS